jgi:SOS-response transcriptional repressor LexA
MNRSLGISEDLLSDGFNVRINTRGPSMFPLIRTGDCITISPDKNPDIGDIIVFRRNDHMFGHRLVKVFEKNGLRYYQTRGDSLFGLDEPVTAGQILGKVIRIERDNVSIARRILILLHPILKFSKLNAYIIAISIKLKAIFRLPNSY